MQTRVLVLLFAAMVVVSAQSQRPTADAQRQDQTNITPTAPQVPAPPVASNVGVSLAAAESSPEPGEGENNSGTDADWAMVRWTQTATVVALGLLVLGWLQLRADMRTASESLNATHDAFILANRPRIIVRNIDVNGLSMYGNALQFAVPEKLAGTLLVTNSGFTGATIIRFHVEWLVTDKLPITNPVFGKPANEMSLVVQPGGSHRLDLPEWELENFDDFASIAGLTDRPNHTLWLIGIVKYRDQLGNLRQTVFGRKLDRMAGRFVPVDYPDYEYAD